MKSVITPILVAALAFSTSSVANDFCTYDQQNIEIGETITIVDPFLVNKAINYYLAKGVDQEAAEKRARSSDWTVFVLECQEQIHFKSSHGDAKAASMLSKGSPVLIPLDHQKEWIDTLLQ
ncbi:hypothetical protein OH460_09110 [Vibrio sp. Makdt]|uniref:hypothetical protein n=1 Tax=Vibrio sp. Makdt TaxID=2998828 RepID=UPI0022CDB065|nr:hypothetical protein [Vibrio sp. Makdt]MDA0152461.1 hypothetical protein [Vibrio sp. Makdt]